MKSLKAIIGVGAISLAGAYPASADTWEKCFGTQADADTLVLSIENFASTRVAMKPLENELFNNKTLNLNDLKKLFGEPHKKRPVGSVGDVIFEWIPLKTRLFSATQVEPKAEGFCTYITSRSVNHQLRATVDLQGNVVYRETRKQRTNR